MADIAAANVTVTINKRWIQSRRKYVQATVAFGNGALTYPTGGVPLTLSKFGFKRFMDALLIMESNSDVLLYDFDRSAVTIGIYYPTQQTGATGNRAGVEFTGGSTAPAATSLEVLAIGW